MKNIFIILILCLFFIGCNKPEPKVIQSSKIELKIDGLGEINEITSSDKSIKNISATTLFEGCELKNDVVSKSLKDGGIEFVKHFTQSGNGLTLTEKFIPENDYINWEIEIEGDGKPWTTGIQTILRCSVPDSFLIWATWGSPWQLKPADSSKVNDNHWVDPFSPQPFRDMNLTYGEHCSLGAAYAIPMISLFSKTSQSGLSLLMSPADGLLDVRMTINTKGEIIQTQRNHRIEKGKKLKFTKKIFIHEGDWRAAMSFVVSQYPDYFIPKIPDVYKINGLGAYSTYEGDLDKAKYQKMGGIVNWKASFDFPFMGLFIPDVKNDDEKWKRVDCNSSGDIIPDLATYTSVSQLRKYFEKMHRYGFYSLAYFNVTEFGAGIEYPKPAEDKKFKFEVYKQANDFLYRHFPNAMIFGSFEQSAWLFRTGKQQINPIPMFHDKPYWSWVKAVAMDCGDSAYSAFLLDQAEKHIRKFPDIDGIAIDRVDWLGEYNWHADDGASWISGKPVRSVFNSWKGFMNKLGPIMHKAHKAIFCNAHIQKLDLMSQTDGIFNEGGFEWDKMNVSAYLTLFKPLIIWSAKIETVTENGKDWFLFKDYSGRVQKEDPDLFLQKQLYMGAFPMAPFPENDHSILPDPKVDKYYIDYGPLFTALYGRKWILKSDVIEVADHLALANIFDTPDQYVIPVVYAGDQKEIKVLIRVDELNKMDKIEPVAVFPGSSEKAVVSSKKDTDKLELTVPVKRGCALVMIKKK
jgi:hypothetical protein